MSPASEAELTEAETHLHVFLWQLIDDAKRLLLILDGKLPVTARSSEPLPCEPERPTGDDLRFRKRTLSRQEESFLLEGVVRELGRSAIGAHVAFVKMMLLRRHAK